MLDNENLKKKLLDMLNECSASLAKYKELRNNGLSKDDIFEAIYNTRKQTINELLELIATK